MQNISKTMKNKAKTDVKLNFNSYINRSNKVQKHEKQINDLPFNLTGSQTRTLTLTLRILLFRF